MDIKNPNAFARAMQQDSRTIRRATSMGFSKYLEELLTMAAFDIRNMGCNIFYKGCQELKTETNLGFLGLPSTIQVEFFDTSMTDVLVDLEQKLVIQNITNFPLFCHNKEEFCMFTMNKQYAGGMPWHSNNGTWERREPNV